MTDDHRKTSQELIQEANRRLRATQDDPTAEPRPASAPSTLPNATRQPEIGGAYQAPKEALPSHSPTDREPGTEPSGPAPSGRPTLGTRLVAMGLRFGIGLALFAGIAFFSSLNDASRDGSGELVSAGDLDVMALQVGDCFNDPEELDEVVFDVAAVPCSEAHDNEVYSLVPITVFGAAFPGDAALQDYSYEECAGDPFSRYVGTDYFDSALEVFTFTPTEESWDDGDRDIVCVLFKLDLTKLTGTARGSGL